MRIKQCAKGHLYDAESSPLCPYCGEDPAVSAIPARFKALGEITFLGSGATSQVFRISGEREYALKIVPCGTDEAKYRNVLYELRIMERLKGEPLAVQLCDHEVAGTGEFRTVYLLEEYHNTLTDHLSDRSFRASELLQLVMGVCDSLLDCKALGVLHLDVQPKNIFVDEPSAVRLGDFSHSLLECDARSNRAPRGTLAYMAPEVYREGACSERSDLYSVGLMLYALFNQKILPFMDSNPEEVSIYKRLAGTPFPELSLEAPELRSELTRIISLACSYDPANRCAGLSELWAELSELYERLHADPEKDPLIYAGAEGESRPAQWESFDTLSSGGNAVMFDADPIATSIFLGPAWGDNERYGDSWEAPETGGYGSPAEDFSQAGAGIGGIEVPDGNLAGGRTIRCRVCDGPIAGGANFCPYCGCKVSLEPPGVDIGKVEFSAIAPKHLVKGDYTIIDLIMYDKASRHIVDTMLKEAQEPVQESRSGLHSVKEGASVKIVLSSPDLTIDDGEETGVWRGGHLDFSFAVFLPEEYRKRQVLFTASVYIDDVIATRLKFIAKCSSFSEQKIAVSQENVFTAFASYASQDRSQVASVIQGMKKIRPDLEVFFDIDSLRSGEDWEQALHREIERCDVLFLFWSRFASESKWVETEWRYALEKKGADCIDPVPVELPVYPPPKELNHKHFNDKLLYIIYAGQDPRRQGDNRWGAGPDGPGEQWR